MKACVSAGVLKTNCSVARIMVASFSSQPRSKGILGNFPEDTRLLAKSGRKSWSTTGRNTSPSFLTDVSAIKLTVMLRRVSMGTGLEAP